MVLFRHITYSAVCYIYIYIHIHLRAASAGEFKRGEFIEGLCKADKGVA